MPGLQLVELRRVRLVEALRRSSECLLGRLAGGLAPRLELRDLRGRALLEHLPLGVPQLARLVERPRELVDLRLRGDPCVALALEKLCQLVGGGIRLLEPLLHTGGARLVRDQVIDALLELALLLERGIVRFDGLHPLLDLRGELVVLVRELALRLGELALQPRELTPQRQLCIRVHGQWRCGRAAAAPPLEELGRDLRSNARLRPEHAIDPIIRLRRIPDLSRFLPRVHATLLRHPPEVSINAGVSAISGQRDDLLDQWIRRAGAHMQEPRACAHRGHARGKRKVRRARGIRGRVLGPCEREVIE